MGYAEGNTYGYTREDYAMETVYIRLLDSGDFNNGEELIDHLRNNNYTIKVCYITPFIDFEVLEDEYYGIETILKDNGVDFRVFN